MWFRSIEARKDFQPRTVLKLLDTKAPKILKHLDSDTDGARDFHQELAFQDGIDYRPELSTNNFNYVTSKIYKQQKELIRSLEQEKQQVLRSIQFLNKIEHLKRKITELTAKANLLPFNNKKLATLPSLKSELNLKLRQLPQKGTQQLEEDEKILSLKILEQEILELEFIEYGCIIDPEALAGLNDKARVKKLLEIFTEADKDYLLTNRQYINRLKLLRPAKIVSKEQYAKNLDNKVYKLEYERGDYTDSSIGKNNYYGYPIPLTSTPREWLQASRSKFAQYGCELPHLKKLTPSDQFETLIQFFTKSDKKYRPTHDQINERINLLENIRQEKRTAEYKSKKRELIGLKASPTAKWLTKLFGNPLKVTY